jgi:hypothetical protein
VSKKIDFKNVKNMFLLNIFENIATKAKDEFIIYLVIIYNIIKSLIVKQHEEH